jgi:DNA-directed RNA polymerase subunit RPC12/RpoP
MGRANRKKRKQERMQMIARRPQSQPQRTRGVLPPNLIDQCDIVPCPECGHEEFSRHLELRRASRLMTGAAMDTLALVPVDRCDQCGHKLDMQKALAQFLKNEEAQSRTNIAGAKPTGIIITP